MKVKNGYTASLVRPSRYNPNNFTSVGSAILYVALLATFFALPYILQLAGFYELLISLGDDYLVIVIDVLISQSLILCFGIVFSLIERANPISGGGYVCRFDFAPMTFGCALVVGLQICLSAFHMEFSEAAGYFGSPVSDGLIDINNLNGNPLWMLLYIALVSALPCVCEELVFRGIIMRGFSRFGGLVSAVLSAAMFSLFHGNYSQLMLQFIGGLAIGLCAYLTKNFAVAIAMHFANNAFALAFSVVKELTRANEGLYGVTVVFSSIIGVALLIAGGAYFVKMYAKRKDGVNCSGEFTRPPKSIPVLLSERSRAENSSIVIDALQIEEFIKYYPDAMRFKRGAFVSLNREARSPAGAITLICVGLALAVAIVILNGFGI